MKKLILWDVDGTLLHTDGIAGDIMRTTMREFFGDVERRERRFFSGKTDWQIIHDSFPDEDRTLIANKMAAFTARYTEHMQQQREELCRRAGTMPGVREVLQALHGAVVQAPLTGNVVGVARLKIELLGLSPYLNIAIGAYGNDHYQREELVPIAAQRAAALYQRTFTGNDIVIIGDTPNDIRCGKRHGARTVSVATGPYSIEELRPHAPDALLNDMSNLDAALAAILGTANNTATSENA